jgi:hypothetical protein
VEAPTTLTESPGALRRTELRDVVNAERRASAIHKNRDLGVREHFDGLTAEDNRRHIATPV